MGVGAIIFGGPESQTRRVPKQFVLTAYNDNSPSSRICLFLLEFLLEFKGLVNP